MKDNTYENYKQNQIERSDQEDSLLMMANKLIHLKDSKRVNLFADEKEEQVMRQFVEKTIEVSVN